MGVQPVTVVKETVPVQDIVQDVIDQGKVRTVVVVESVQTAGQVVILDCVVVTLGI